jgi:hypothetical protein
VMLEARCVTLRARWGDAKSSLGDADSSMGDARTGGAMRRQSSLRIASRSSRRSTGALTQHRATDLTRVGRGARL